MEKMTARERISKAIIGMLDEYPFYSDLLIRAEIKELPKEEPCQSMAVDLEGDLYYSEEFVATLDDDELNFVLLHECLHKVYRHLPRLGDRDALVWNIATDIVIDYEVAHKMSGGYRSKTPPKGRIIADRNGTIEIPNLGIKVDNIEKKAADEIYGEIYHKCPKSPPKMKSKPGEGKGDDKDDKDNQDGQGQGQLGRNIDNHDYKTRDGKAYKSLTEFEKEQIRQEAKEQVVEAAFRAKKRGNLPANIERMVEKLTRGEVNWRRYIWKHITAELPFDYAMSRPNRRYISQGIYLPGMRKESVEIVAFIDLSGSIDSPEKDAFVAELCGVTDAHPNVKMTIVSHDSKIHGVTELTKATKQQILEADYRGGGGTDHRPCFEWLDENKPNVRLVLIFTDGHTVFPDKGAERMRDIVWVITRDGVDEGSIPFGNVVKIENA
ncbi:hypothetical protein GOV11_00860 [Candidatus Woesearchaeota archaeon]|nr:hypothetical protein [Candidatus Woesearchaeota archaeon]